MQNLFYYPYPYKFDFDLKMINDHCNNKSINDTIEIYKLLREYYGDLEWLTLNDKQKIKRIITYRDEFLTA